VISFYMWILGTTADDRRLVFSRIMLPSVLAYEAAKKRKRERQALFERHTGTRMSWEPEYVRVDSVATLSTPTNKRQQVAKDIWLSGSDVQSITGNIFSR
jgi:hypothetical protein